MAERMERVNRFEDFELENKCTHGDLLDREYLGELVVPCSGEPPRPCASVWGVALGCEGTCLWPSLGTGCSKHPKCTLS